MLRAAAAASCAPAESAMLLHPAAASCAPAESVLLLGARAAARQEWEKELAEALNGICAQHAEEVERLLTSAAALSASNIDLTHRTAALWLQREELKDASVELQISNTDAEVAAAQAAARISELERRLSDEQAAAHAVPDYLRAISAAMERDDPCVTSVMKAVLHDMGVLCSHGTVSHPQDLTLRFMTLIHNVSPRAAALIRGNLYAPSEGTLHQRSLDSMGGLRYMPNGVQPELVLMACEYFRLCGYVGYVQMSTDATAVMPIVKLDQHSRRLIGFEEMTDTITTADQVREAFENNKKVQQVQLVLLCPLVKGVSPIPVGVVARGSGPGSGTHTQVEKWWEAVAHSTSLFGYPLLTLGADGDSAVRWLYEQHNLLCLVAPPPQQQAEQAAHVREEPPRMTAEERELRRLEGYRERVGGEGWEVSDDDDDEALRRAVLEVDGVTSQRPKAKRRASTAATGTPQLPAYYVCIQRPPPRRTGFCTLGDVVTFSNGLMAPTTMIPAPDPNHLLKKTRNQMLNCVNRVLWIGDYTVNLVHPRIVYLEHRTECGLGATVVNPSDKQSVPCAIKLLQLDKKWLLDLDSSRRGFETHATRAYLLHGSLVHDAFFKPDIGDFERVRCIWQTVFFFEGWRDNLAHGHCPPVPINWLEGA